MKIKNDIFTFGKKKGYFDKNNFPIYKNWVDDDYVSKPPIDLKGIEKKFNENNKLIKRYYMLNNKSVKTEGERNEILNLQSKIIW